MQQVNILCRQTMHATLLSEMRSVALTGQSLLLVNETASQAAPSVVPALEL